MGVLRFVFYIMAALGLAITVIKHGQSAFSYDPLSALIAGGSILTVAVGYVMKALGYDD